MVAKTKTHDMVDAKEVEALLNLLKNHGIGEPQAMASIGYKNARGALIEMRRVGLVKRSIYMALKGLIAERKLGEKTPEVFSLSFDDAGDLFIILRQIVKEQPGKGAQLRPLIGKLAVHMTKGG